MLIVTDKAAIDAAFAAKTPRPFREVMLEIYPDATEDRNGRFHAPHDGYECSITGMVFRAGEFLPMEENEDYIGSAMGVTRKFPQGKDAVTGEVYRWDGTRAQNREVWSLLIAQSKAFDAANSAHIGKVGEKVSLTLTVSHIHSYEGVYATMFINIMKQGKDVVIYKGTKKLGTKGETIRIDAKVKSHGERDGVAQTVIERPKAPKITETPRSKEVARLAAMVRSGEITESQAATSMKYFDLGE